MARTKHRGRPTMPPAREAALKALTACLKGADIQATLDQALAASKIMDTRDVGLATELAYGTLRLKIRLDWLLGNYLKNPESLPASMRLSLAVAAYEITQLDKVPAYASVDWCVEYIKGINPRLSKVANAVLRRIADLGEDANSISFFRSRNEDETTVLARYHAAPPWLVRLWFDAYEDAAEQYLAASAAAPALGIRVRPSADSSVLHDLLDAPGLLEADGSGLAFTKAPSGLSILLESRDVLRQSYAGQQAMHSIGMDTWNGPIWDCCCGRGGKSMLMADHKLGPILASDPRRPRLKGLIREIHRLGIKSILPVRTRADLPAPLSGTVPTILVDAPCSGLGVMARRPDSKFKRSPEDLDALVAIQARILDNVASHLAPGGTLAYVTCTLNPAENEQQVRSFLNRNPHFSLSDEHQTRPDTALGEFFYAAKLQA